MLAQPTPSLSELLSDRGVVNVLFRVPLAFDYEVVGGLRREDQGRVRSDADVGEIVRRLLNDIAERKRSADGTSEMARRDLQLIESALARPTPYELTGYQTNNISASTPAGAIVAPVVCSEEPSSAETAGPVGPSPDGVLPPGCGLYFYPGCERTGKTRGG